MSFASKDITFILTLLNEETCGTALTFEQISSQFYQYVPKSDYLRLGNALVLLLQNRDLTPIPQQRLIIFFLFHEMYKNENQPIHLNPFAPVFISVLSNHPGENLPNLKHFHWLISPVTAHERWFVRNLLLHHQTNSRDLFKKTPNQILQMNLPSTIDDQDQKQIKEKVQEQRKALPVVVQCHLPAVIDDPEMNQVSRTSSPSIRLFIDKVH